MARTKERSGFPRKSGCSWRNSAGRRLSPSLPSPDQSALGPGNRVLAKANLSFQPTVSTFTEGTKEAEAHRNIYRLPTITSPELRDFWTPPRSSREARHVPRTSPRPCGTSLGEDSHSWNQLPRGLGRSLAPRAVQLPPLQPNAQHLGQTVPPPTPKPCSPGVTSSWFQTGVPTCLSVLAVGICDP